jgi:hypothetical protein
MSLPALSNWDATRVGVHQAAQIIGVLRKTLVQPLPNYAHYGLYVTSDGVTTGSLPLGGELALEFAGRSIVFTPESSDAHYISLSGHTQNSLTDAVLDALKMLGHPVQINREKLAATRVLEVDMDTAADYAEALYSIYTAIARFRARLFGAMSPMVVFPHGFDLSFLWFSRGFVEEQDPHLNFGFSPGSPGLPRPYIYMYARPIPDGLFDVKLPALARWYRERWHGVVMDYDTLAKESDHETVLEDTLYRIQAVVSPLMPK